MRQSTAGKRTGIQWTFTKQLEDLDFADDISLLSHRQQDAQEKLCHVAADAETTGLQINIGKTEVMRVNNRQQDPMRLHQEDIKEVDNFVYLGSVIRIFNTNVKSVLLYGAETWRATKTNTHKLQTFTNKCLRNILGIRWPEVVSNKQLWTGRGKPQYYRDRDPETKMGTDRPHSSKACSKRHQAGS